MNTEIKQRMSEENYERLVTLAKEEYEKRYRALNISEAEEKLYSTKGYLYSTLQEKQKMIAKKIMSPAIKEYTKAPEKWNIYLTSACRLEKEIEIQINPDEKRIADTFVNKKAAVGDFLKLTLYPTKEEEIIVYGYTEQKEADKEQYGANHREIIVVDLAYFLAGIYLYRQLELEMKRLTDLSEQERKEDVHYKAIIKRFAPFHKKFPELFKMKGKEIVAYCKSYLATTLPLMENSNAYFNPYKIAEVTAADSHEKEVFQYFMFKRMLAGNLPFHGYFDFVNYSKQKKKGQLVLTDGFAPFLHFDDLVNLVEEDKVSVVLNYGKYKESQTDYAKSFMTKKNQSEKLKERIQKSLFGNYFGYVEYDEDIDYDAIAQYEEEFVTFYKKHFSDLDLSKNAIRFRKLGQHRAAGLYYPQMKCLCVDISHPHSFVHELGHLIDYEFGGLSEGIEFSQIRKFAQEYYKNKEKSESEFGKQLRGKSKYNIDYYSIPTEIFARSFEMYVYYVWSENSSLLDKDYHREEYPCTKENLERIKKYFDMIFT